MSLARRSRGLAAILVLDIVGSTEIAAELGDRRWRHLLGKFRGLVRAELRRHKGHEEDTAGDGFFATFRQPAEAVRSAVAIVHRVQEIGLDVRCAVHFGEVEALEGRRGGIAVHIGSRVMSVAGPAQVLITSTVRDLVVGAGVEVEDAGMHRLKGVQGEWQVWRVRSLDGTPVPSPLAGDEGVALRVLPSTEYLHGAMVSFGSLWVAAGDKVLRVRGDSPEVIARIPMPPGMSAGSIAADPDTNSLWVADCGCPIE